MSAAARRHVEGDTAGRPALLQWDRMRGSMVGSRAIHEPEKPMAIRTSTRSAKAGRPDAARERSDGMIAARIRFRARLHRPAATGGRAKAVTWTFLMLPKDASARLPSRGMVAIEGTINRSPFRGTLEPDGRGGHWLEVDRKLREAAGVEAGDVVTLEIAPVALDQVPEPKMPVDLRKALAAAAEAQKVWADVTPVARRDWIQWIVSAKQAETRARRIRNACSMLAAGKRRPCCFDRSGMYGKNLGCPVPEGPGGP